MSAEGARFVPHYFPGTGHSYDRVVAWTTLGLDRRWKRRMVELLPPDASAVLELACGTGILTERVLARCPGARVLGVDVTEDYLRVSRERFAGDPRVELRLGDATTTPVVDRGPFDVLISSYIPKYVDVGRLLDHVTPALRPGALVVLHDFTRPRGTLPRALWRVWMWLLERFAPWFHPEWSNLFDRSLKDLIVRSRWADDLERELAVRGYRDVRRLRLSFGTAALVVARRP
jgi:demethylmenaquinone methyltransferase/2-methoxy-6-polyprenyl-1,4-benzoquinol methylase